jgi:ATP-dependent DNA helicase RecQ
LSNEQSEKVQLQFLIESKEVIRYISLHPDDESVITSILRNYPGVFDVKTNINTVFVAKNSNSNEADVIALLVKLKESGIVDLMLIQNESKITFLEVREDDRTINRVAKYLEKQNLNKKNQLASVVTYVSDELQCKSRLLLTYFGESVHKDCGVCSFCLGKKTKTIDRELIVTQVLSMLKECPKTSRELATKMEIDEHQLLEVLRQLLEYNVITINTKNQFILT